MSPEALRLQLIGMEYALKKGPALGREWRKAKKLQDKLRLHLSLVTIEEAMRAVSV